jgi:hypothetical protein
MTELDKKFNLLEHETKERYKKTIEEFLVWQLG